MRPPVDAHGENCVKSLQKGQTLHSLKLPIIYYLFPITSCLLSIINCKMPNANYKFPITKSPKKKNISISSQLSYEFDFIELHSCFPLLSRKDFHFEYLDLKNPLYFCRNYFSLCKIFTLD